jgi:hypothetical protein
MGRPLCCPRTAARRLAMPRRRLEVARHCCRACAPPAAAALAPRALLLPPAVRYPRAPLLLPPRGGRRPNVAPLLLPCSRGAAAARRLAAAENSPHR